MCEVWRVEKSVWIPKIGIWSAERMHIRENRVWGVVGFFCLDFSMILTRFWRISRQTTHVPYLAWFLLSAESCWNSTYPRRFVVVERPYFGFWSPLRAKTYISDVFECPGTICGDCILSEIPKRYSVWSEPLHVFETISDLEPWAKSDCWTR